MFRGTKPEAQPRTLRSIAESKGTSSNFESESVPPTPPYNDKAQVSTETVSSASRPVHSSADKSPFRNTTSRG